MPERGHGLPSVRVHVFARREYLNEAPMAGHPVCRACPGAVETLQGPGAGTEGRRARRGLDDGRPPLHTVW